MADLKSTAQKWLLYIGMGAVTLTGILSRPFKAQQQTENKPVKENVASRPTPTDENAKTARFYDAQNTNADTDEQEVDVQAKLQKIREKLKQDSLDKVIQKNVEEVGFDLRYDASKDWYHLETNNSSGMISASDLNYEQVVEDYLAKQKELFSKPTEYIHQNVDICERISDPDCILASFLPDRNVILVNHFTMENPDKAAELMMETVGCSRHDADSLVNVLYKELNNPESLESRVFHEESHRDDFERNFFMPNLVYMRAAQIQFLSEIKATMQQGGKALEKYHEDGDFAHFAPLSRYIKEQDKSLLEQTPDKEQQKELIGKIIKQRWLDKWNQKDSPYNGEVFLMLSSGTGESMFLQGNVQETEESRKEYERRVNDMFKDIHYLGDMRGVIDPNFSLNPELADEYLAIIRSDAFDGITKNSKTNAEAYGRLAELFTMVRDCDSDGTRTQEEQNLINQTIKTLQEKAANGESYGAVAVKKQQLAVNDTYGSR